MKKTARQKLDDIDHKSTPMRGNALWYNPERKAKFILATECPSCKKHIAAWAANSDTFMYLGRQ